MFLRLLYQSLIRQKRRKLLALTAVAMGMTVTTAMIAVRLDIGDKMSNELRTLGANILVTPSADSLDVQIGGVNLKPASDGAYIAEADLPKLNRIFWSNNIVGYSPMLDATVRIAGSHEPVPIIGTYFAKGVELKDSTYVTGVKKTHPWWKVEGEWPRDEQREILLGARLAKKLQRTASRPGYIYLQDRETKISGILHTGDVEEDAVIAPIAMAQELIGRPGAVRRVFVSALTKPEDDFARRDPRTMSPEMLERWSCTPYANSIAYQIGEALPNVKAEQIRKIAQNEGVVLSKISGLMSLVALAAVLASVLAVSAAMAAGILERRREIGLLKSLGAANFSVGSLFAAEAALLGLAGAAFGVVAGFWLAQKVSLSVFQSNVAWQPALVPLILLLGIFVTFAGSSASIRKALRVEPAMVLRGDV